MNKFLLFTTLAISLVTKAQITITSSQMPVSGDTIRYSNATLASVGDYTTTGANHTWDFSGLIPTAQALRNFKNGLQTPYSIMFGINAYGEKTQDTVPIPTIPIPGVPAITITDVYNFYSKTSSKFIVEGLGLKLNNIPVPNFYSNEDELYLLPLNYLDRDSTTFRFSTISNTLIPFQYVKQGHRITEVDGWGSITTPYGSENCLRVVTTQYSIDTLKGTITLPIVGTQPFNFGFPNYQRSYQWLTLGEHIPYLEVSGTYNNNTFTANQVKFRQAIVSFVGLAENEKQTLNVSLFPNPVNSGLLSLNFPKNVTSVNANIFNTSGQLIKQVNNLNVNNTTINVSNLSAGVYFVELISNSTTQKFKIIVE